MDPGLKDVSHVIVDEVRWHLVCVELGTSHQTDLLYHRGDTGATTDGSQTIVFNLSGRGNQPQTLARSQYQCCHIL